MANQIKLPNLGENIESGQVVNILVGVGDVVENGQNVLELETDKASIEIPVEVAGTVKKIHTKVGATLACGEVFITIEPTSSETVTAKEPAQAEAVSAASNTESKDVSATPEASPAETKVASATEPSATSPIASNTESKDVSAAPQASPAETKVASATASSATSPIASNPAPAAPSTRRFAREIGIDIYQVPGTGKAGRISIDDVKAFAKKQNLARGPSLVTGTVSKPLPDFGKWGEVEVQPMTTIRAKTAENLSHAWTTIPHVTQFDKADITELESQRKLFSKQVEDAGGKLTITAILLKVLAVALKRFPQFNASIDVANNAIIQKKYCHIGIAVDTDRGLLVPVIRDVNTKSITELSVELTVIAEKARNKKLGIDDMQGGTITISNLGGIGGTSFTPIVRWPEVAILGIARAAMEPVYIDGEFQPRKVATIALSYDHRVIDGADGARFLRWIAQAMERPFLLSL